ncbi:MAG: single-stranded-DNA-specific exonuclease RecJ [Candidatus Magasanikbacteria bacterium CG10_big_fil_rev_8_21_14_0_10_40_10]|uniref:Single-stranded-DNA-specific exonuclease RecJ n=1 Tax=Candidatus Magasanikbacteria bacterium CG10_big_fil_rev_8_21_14_0_10_40_10 TaxID=1974648 RepID=A0A2M6W512_9BACT|nr:MAG: single-stranded-DNA-specific exonuclease RecJ [Candidatus Magasanikbacteria bacterium CG10_big_fil_rev_8_21_14_0_10_40_10]
MKWITAPNAEEKFYQNHPELPAIIARLLWNRDLRAQQQIDEFLNPDYSQDIHDPFLFNDMAKAVKIINRAIVKQKNIVVYGDYDADGVCASAILVNTLRKLGANNISAHIPHRETEGYGLNSDTVDELMAQKTDLIITCDCGISNYSQVKQAKKKGLEVIITDHHTVGDKIPPADTIIHPKMPKEKYPDKTLCGGAVAFKLAQGLLKKHQEKNTCLSDGQTHEGFEKWMLDLVALSSIGDMVPLLGESRTLTRYGLVVLNKTQNLGLRKLFTIAGLCDEKGELKRKLDTHTVGWQIVPRLNAAGRMNHANTAYNLLITTNEDEAQRLAEQLNQNNIDRQKSTDQLVSEAKKYIENTQQIDQPIIFAFGSNWPVGLLGLISGRLKDFYNRPVLALTQNNDEIVASGRSLAQFNLIEALQTIPRFFSKFGGHPQACGLSLADKSQLEDFKQELIELARAKLDGQDMTAQINIEAEVNLEDVDWKLYDILQKFEPFGVGNEEPKYMARGLQITNITPVGQDGKHLRLMVKHNNHVVRKTIGFGLGDVNRHPDDWKNNLRAGDIIDMVFAVSVNEWNGNRELQLTIEDIKKT